MVLPTTLPAMRVTVLPKGWVDGAGEMEGQYEYKGIVAAGGTADFMFIARH